MTMTPSDLALLFTGALLVNNFVLAQFLGLCPFMGITRSHDTALATSVATAAVLCMASVIAWGLYNAVLVPLELEYLRTLLFIVVIAGVVQLTQHYVHATSPLLHQMLGIYLPLITSNCAILGFMLLAVGQQLSLFETVVYSLGTAAGFALVMVLFGAMRESLSEQSLPLSLRGAPITFITAGLMSLAFMGFQGFGQ